MPSTVIIARMEDTHYHSLMNNEGVNSSLRNYRKLKTQRKPDLG